MKLETFQVASNTEPVYNVFSDDIFAIATFSTEKEALSYMNWHNFWLGFPSIRAIFMRDMNRWHGFESPSGQRLYSRW